MEFAKLIAPDGDWGKVWLAAHWDKKLKKQDYLEIDLRKLVISWIAKRALMSLRATGHLLVGACKVYARKASLYEDEAQEVKTKLMMAFSSSASAGDAIRQDMDIDNWGRGLLENISGVNSDLAMLANPLGLLGGKRHVARLEDITLRGLEEAIAAQFQIGDDLFGAMPREVLEALELTLRKPKAVPPGLFDMFDAMPLVALSDDAMVFNEDEGSAVPLEWNLPLPDVSDHRDGAESPEVQDADPVPIGPGDEIEDEPMEAHVPLPGAAPAKRRRRGYIVFDDGEGGTEIPKEVYQGYISDRSAITRTTLLDYAVVLPHYSPQLPSFTTPFTDMCSELQCGVRFGTEVAEKRRRLAQEAEFANHGQSFRAAWEVPSRPGPEPLPEGLNPFINGPPPGGLRNAAAATPLREVPAVPAMTDEMLLMNPPTSMGAVVTGAMDEEDQSGNVDARVGYSGRTEKMHRFLAKEFKEAAEPALSYQQLCRQQGSGKRELIAGCFFELLVLKSNDVISLQQDAPQADIHISKAKSWSK